jgi:hypothetical protein
VRFTGVATLPLIIVVLVAALPIASPAAADSVKQVFEKLNLLGVFAGDCNKPPGPSNTYQVVRLIDANSAQIDAMNDSRTQAATMFVDKAEEVKPNVVKLVGTMGGTPLGGTPLEFLWQIEPQGLLWTDMKVGGVVIMRDGMDLVNQRPAGGHFQRCKTQ